MFSWWRSFGLTALSLAVALLAFALMVKAELGPRGDLPLQIDEWYFATCAARGNAAGEAPLTGCHDNKGPLIFPIYQLLSDPQQPYAESRFKWGGFGLALINAALLAALARRVVGRGSASLAFSLMLLCAAGSTMYVTLKTEPLGLSFVLAGLLVLAHAQRPAPPWRLVSTGALFGLSLLAKQTYVFALLGLVVSALVQHAACWPSGRGARLKAVAMLLLGAGLPFALLLAVFAVAGKLLPLLASLFLYPSLYVDPSATPHPSALARWAWRFGQLAEAMRPHLPLLMLAVPGVVLSLVVDRKRASVDGEAAATGLQGPLVSVLLGLLALLLVAPIMFPYHLMPMLVLAIVPACAFLLGIKQAVQRASPTLLRAGQWSLLLLAALWTLSVWFGPGGRSNTGRELFGFEKIDTGGARYGYVVGAWPEFFTFNGLVPASEVMYPNGLPGVPSFWGFQRPDPESLKGRFLTVVQQYNAAKLTADFAKTPPRFIHVVDAMARSPGLAAPTDIPLLADYITRHCQLLRHVPGRMQYAGSLYQCSNGR